MSLRPTDEIRADLECQRRYLPEPTDWMERLAADVGPLLDEVERLTGIARNGDMPTYLDARSRMLTAEAERDALRDRLEEAQRERARAVTIAANAVDAALLTSEVHARGIVDPVDVIACIAQECLANRADLAHLRDQIGELREKLATEQWAARNRLDTIHDAEAKFATVRELRRLLELPIPPTGYDELGRQTVLVDYVLKFLPEEPATPSTPEPTTEEQG